jgi:uncharacterized membrane protein HdeD (DUF308 family)
MMVGCRETDLSRWQRAMGMAIVLVAVVAMWRLNRGSFVVTDLIGLLLLRCAVIAYAD